MAKVDVRIIYLKDNLKEVEDELSGYLSEGYQIVNVVAVHSTAHYLGAIVYTLAKYMDDASYAVPAAQRGYRADAAAVATGDGERA